MTNLNQPFNKTYSLISLSCNHLICGTATMSVVFVFGVDMMNVWAPLGHPTSSMSSSPSCMQSCWVSTSYQKPRSPGPGKRDPLIRRDSGGLLQVMRNIRGSLMADEFKSNFTSTIQNMQQDLNISEYDQTSVASEVRIIAPKYMSKL